jgi:hypothetical protein
MWWSLILSSIFIFIWPTKNSFGNHKTPQYSPQYRGVRGPRAFQYPAPAPDHLAAQDAGICGQVLTGFDRSRETRLRRSGTSAALVSSSRRCSRSRRRRWRLSLPTTSRSSSCDEPSATVLHGSEALHRHHRITNPVPLASFCLPPLLISEHPRQSSGGRTRGSSGLSLSHMRRSDLTRPWLHISAPTPALHSAGVLASQFSLLARAPA